MFNLCTVIYEEDKHAAIPEVLRISKYRYTVDYFIMRQMENERKSISDKQFAPIDEDDAQQLIPYNWEDFYDKEIFKVKIQNADDLPKYFEDQARDVLIWLLRR